MTPTQEADFDTAVMLNDEASALLLEGKPLQAADVLIQAAYYAVTVGGRKALIDRARQLADGAQRS